SLVSLFAFFFPGSADHRDLHSFPTRRSSDLEQARPDILSLSFGGYTDGDAPLLALGDAIGALPPDLVVVAAAGNHGEARPFWPRSEEHTSELQSLRHLVCRLLLEKKKIKNEQ